MREPLERAHAEAKEERDALAARWAKEKEALEKIKETTRKIDELRMEAERAEREGNLQRVAEIRYGELPALERAALRARAVRDRVDGEGRSGRGRHRRDRRALDRHPGRPAARGGDGEADPPRGAAAPARRRPGRGGLRRRERPAPRAYGPAGSGPPDRLVRVPRPDRRRQDRARTRARRVHVRRREGDGAHRHERVPGASHRLAPRRRAARLRRLRRGRPADRGGSPPPVLRRAPRRDREGAIRRCSTCCCRCSTTAD